ncbi:MAG: Na/Pi cotransporter family protein [Lachnospiraceae bacterium]|uniref:Na/Pi cotransporter family protein n=1 Tax=Parablautia sp. Marseille-Q6255 TaxID=3039593 RepID=UPI0024BD37A7|nr:Na/Pi cotransporter family protein [Parablautia sp. Marseille-Q6255]
MDIFGVLTMVGGLALFLFGMHVMGEGLSKASGGRLEKILEKLTSSTLKGVLLGAGVTAVIQSSSATTVMVVGFVNSGIMTLERAVGIIMGANIGTTITSWILSLSGIQGDNFFIQMLKPSSFSPILAIIGVAMLLFSKKDKKKDAGTIMIGFAVLMTGMDAMSAAVKPLADVPEFTNLFLMFENPVLGLIAGAVLTAVIQSSSASVGILQALCVTGAVSYGSAIPIIMGQNIGTCVTALISAIGAKKNAKRTAFVHLYFNLIGTVIFMILFYAANAFVHFGFLGDAANAAGIAVVHTTFNVLATLLWLPFNKVLVKLAKLTVRDTKDEESHTEKSLAELGALDNRFLDNPALAMAQCRDVCASMANVTVEALDTAINQLHAYSEEKLALVVEDEDIVDKYEDRLGTYLVQVAKNEMQTKDSHTLSVLLHSIGDVERISDHAVNIVNAAKEIYDKNLAFSEAAVEELEVFSSAVKEVVSLAMEAMKTENYELAKKVEPLEEVIDDIGDEVKQRHIDRLREGRCTIELGFVLSDLTTSYKRIADHCSNIAVCLIQAENNEFGRHEYLNSLKEEDNKYFKEQFREYRRKYSLPERVKGTPKVDMRARMQQAH